MIFIFNFTRGIILLLSTPLWEGIEERGDNYVIIYLQTSDYIIYSIYEI